jgi:hypothetical protein
MDSENNQTMDPAVQAKWDTWCRAIVAACLEDFAGVVGEETGREDGKLWKECRKLRHRIAKLNAETLLLRSQVTVLQRARAKAVLKKAEQIVGNRRGR